MSSASAVLYHGTRAFPASLNVLTLTPFYPTAQDEAEGCFIAEPLSVSEQLSIRNQVVAVRPAYRALATTAASTFPVHRQHFLCVPGNPGLASSGAFLYAAITRKVETLICNSRIGLVHAHGALPCGHAAMLIRRKFGIPFVVTVHGLDAFSIRQVQSTFWRRRTLNNSRAVYEDAQRVICVSAKVRDQVLEYAPRARTAVIYNAVNSEMFMPSPSSAPGAMILSVGNLIPTKGHELLLRAFARVHSTIPAATLRIIGDGPEKSSLRRLTVALGISDSTQFLPRCSRTEIAQQMKRCTVFVLPSKYEGLGCVYLEAMACAKPAIGCYGQGIDEIIASGKNGWLIHPDSLEELGHALITLLRSPSLREEIGSEARKTILHRFQLVDQATQLSELYWECVG